MIRNNEEVIEISSGRDLKKIEDNPNAHFVLTDDIEFKDKRGLWEFFKPNFMKDYTNFYDSKRIEELNGTLDGNGHTIRNFSLSQIYHRGALIMYNHGTIKNLNLENVYISGSSVMGGIVAENTGTIKNCSVQGKVKPTEYKERATRSGGIAGVNEGNIIECEFKGSTRARHEAGGICGKNLKGIISECEVNGKVSGERFVGGIVGDNTCGKIEKSHSSGKISGNRKSTVGSIVARNMDKDAVVSFCSSDSIVTSGGKSMGGLIGKNCGILKNSFFYGSFESPYLQEHAGILAGVNSGEIKDCFWNSVDCSIEMKVSEESNFKNGTISNVRELDELDDIEDVRSLIIADEI